MSIQAVILAAGASTRMGSPKALLDLDWTNFITRVATAAREGGASGVTVVLGPPDGTAIRARLPPGVGWAWNPDPTRGMLSSAQAALATMPAGTSALLVWPVDLPKVAPATVRAILDAAPGRLVIPRHAGRGGHPVRVPRSLFGALAALPVERGLRALVEDHAAAVLHLEVDDAGVLEDIDTPADLDRTRAAGPRGRKPRGR